MNKMYDVLIVGSGPTAYGALLGIDKNKTIAMVSHGKGGGYFKDSVGDNSYALQFGGGIDSWHGVSSLELFSKHFPDELNNAVDFFCNIYEENRVNTEYLLNDGIYIPSKKITSKHLVRAIEAKNCNFIVDQALKIEAKDGYSTIICNNIKLDARKVIVCAGAVGSMELLVESNLGVKKTSIGNHINGYCKYNIANNRQEWSSHLCKNGHIKKVKKGVLNDKNYIIYPRPSSFDFKNYNNLIKHKSAYSRKSDEVYGLILKSLSPGLLIEALYNRYGRWFGGNNSNNYFQIESDNVYEINNKNEIIVNLKNLDEVINSLKKIDIFSDVSTSSIVSGIHFYDTLHPVESVGIVSVRNDWKKLILISDSAAFSSIGGSHHTFSIMAMNYLAASKNYE